MIYLDHSATTKPYPEVTEAVSHAMQTDFFNPSSVYKPAKAVARLELEAKQALGDILGCDANELVQTSGATESTNTVLKGLFARSGHRLPQIIVSAADHDATLASCKYLKTKGADIVYLTPDPKGYIRLEDLQEALNEQTLAVSILHVNNETGICQDLPALVSLIREKAPQTKIHADLVQSWGKVPLNLHALNLDFASFSAHKIHGPKGVGLLYHKDQVLFDPLIHGGGQQKNLRSGTENWPLLNGMKTAARIQANSFEQRKSIVRHHREVLEAKLTALGGIVNFPESVPEILSVSFPQYQGETILHMLEAKEIYLSTSSACQTNSGAISHVLSACNVPKEQANGTLRISLDASNTEEEINRFVEELTACLKQLELWQM